MSFVPAQAVTNARNDVGYHEGPNNANKFSFWQYGDYTAPWCASAISKWAYDAGYRWPRESAYREKGDASVYWLSAHAGGLRRDRSYMARPGDVLCLEFSPGERHVELILADGGPGYEQRTGRPRWATVGGNTGNAVQYRTRYERDLYSVVALTHSPQVDPGAEPIDPALLLLKGAPMTTVAAPISGPQGRTATARPVPFAGQVLLENGARLVGDKKLGESYVWRDASVAKNAILIDIAPTVYPHSHKLAGQPDGHGIVALYDPRNGKPPDTYVGAWLLT